MVRPAWSLWTLLAAVIVVIPLASGATVLPVVTLTATTALIMGGTTHPLSVPPDTQPFVDGRVAAAENGYLVPGGLCAATGCSTAVAVITPERMVGYDASVAQGLANLDACVHGSVSCVTNQAVPGTVPPPYGGAGSQLAIFGVSQSATIATFEKRMLAGEPNPPDVGFALAANPNRPNGGISARLSGLTIPFLGMTFSGPTPTNTPFPTIDVARQYDGIADAPLNLLNPLADLNAVLGAAFLHTGTAGLNLADASLQSHYGDTSYYLFPTKTLPLLMPLARLGVPAPLLAVLDAPLRVLVEAGYNRTVSPGQPARANPLYVPNPVTLATNLVASIPTGLDDGLQQLGLGRPFHTTAAGPFGVGGPPLDPPAPATARSLAASPSPAAASRINTHASSAPSVARSVAGSRVVGGGGRAHPPKTPPKKPRSRVSHDSTHHAGGIGA